MAMNSFKSEYNSITPTSTTSWLYIYVYNINWMMFEWLVTFNYNILQWYNDAINGYKWCLGLLPTIFNSDPGVPAGPAMGKLGSWSYL